MRSCIFAKPIHLKINVGGSGNSQECGACRGAGPLKKASFAFRINRSVQNEKLRVSYSAQQLMEVKGRIDPVQHHEAQKSIMLFRGDRGGVNEDGAGILCGLKGVTDAFGLLIGQCAQVMHRLVRGFSFLPDRPYDSVVL